MVKKSASKAKAARSESGARQAKRQPAKGRGSSTPKGKREALVARATRLL